MCTSFKVLQYSILRMILYFVPVRSLHVLLKRTFHEPWTAVTAPKMSCDVTCVRHMFLHFTVMFAASISVRHVLGNIS